MNLYETFIQPISQNQVVTGLSFTALLGALGYQFRRIPGYLENAVRRATVVSLSVNSSDPTYTWIERWLAAHPYSNRAKRVILRSYDDDGDRAGYAGAASQWALSPGDGLHWFWWRKHFIWLSRNTETPPARVAAAQRQRIETIHLNTFGRSQATLRAIIEDARQAARTKDIVSIRLWRGYWAPVRGKRPRSMDTIVLQKGQIERVLAAFRAFESSSADYMRKGIPYRLGCLFKGPGGTGKTSLVFAIAGLLRRPVCLLNLGSVADDDALFSAVIDAPADAIILIEDIDCAGSSHTRKTSEKSETPQPRSNNPSPPAEREGVTKGGLLNALDGVVTPDGRIFVMTTNHPELLDPALVRPGRADVVEDFQFLGVAEQAQMAALYYGPGRFVPLPELQSPAAMQAAFMRWPGDPGKARASLEGSRSLSEAAD